MFKSILQETGVIKDSLDSISSLITEASFELSKDGIFLIAMDPASVAMTVFKILPTAFLEYHCDEPQKITINLPNLVNIFKRSKANDQITMTLEKNKLKIEMKGDSKRTFSLPLIDNPPTEQKVPDLSFKTKIELIGEALKDGVKDASMVSDCVVFEADNSSFSIKSFGDISETKLELAKDSPSLLNLDSKDGIKSKYSIDYLDRMLKAVKMADKVMIQFSNDYPMKLECTAVDKLQLSFILAPRVDTE